MKHNVRKARIGGEWVASRRELALREYRRRCPQGWRPECPAKPRRYAYAIAQYVEARQRWSAEWCNIGRRCMIRGLAEALNIELKFNAEGLREGLARLGEATNRAMTDGVAAMAQMREAATGATGAMTAVAE